jgi:hypothetical protein
MHDKINLILGGVFILFYAAQRFNTPPTNRSSTTAGRYFMGLFSYCLVGVAFYATIVKFPHLLTFFVQGDENSVPEWAKEISSPLLVALSLTVLLQKLPFLSSLDHWICEQLQHMAAIPYEVRRLGAELHKDTLSISDEDQVTVRQQLEDEGFDPKDILFEPRHAPANAWTRLAALLHKVQDWESDRRMASYLSACQGELENLRRRQEWLASKAKTCFRLLDENAAAGVTGKAHEAVTQYEDDFTEQVAQLHQNVLDFIARGVLHAELTDSARVHRLQSLGFAAKWPPNRVFTLNQMMLLFGVVCIVMLSGSVLFSDSGRGVQFGSVLMKTIRISLIYSIAVACAVLPKAKWKFARIQVGDVRPTTFYLVAGLMAVGISQVTTLVFNSVSMGGIQPAWARFQLTYPWLLITFGTALMTAVLVDNPTFHGMSRWQQRCTEGLLQAAVMLGVAYLTHSWLEQRSEVISVVQRVPPLTSVMGMSGMVGFVIGFCIPTWYRQAQRRHRQVSAGASVSMLSFRGSPATQ